MQARFFFSYSVLTLSDTEEILSKSEVLWLNGVEKKKSIFLIGIAVSKGLAEQEL